MMSDENQYLVDEILARVPSLRGQYETTARGCVADGLPGEIPEFFISESTTALRENLKTDPEGSRAALFEIASILEREYGQDFDRDIMIRSTFVVYMGDRGVADLLGPKLGAIAAESRDWRAKPQDQAFVERVVAALPVLGPIAAEETNGDHGDVLVHSFLADVVRYLEERFAAGELDDVRAVMAVMEREWGGEVDEPIAVSFVEHMPYPDEPAAGLIDLLGPKLRAELTAQRGSGQSR